MQFIKIQKIIKNLEKNKKVKMADKGIKDLFKNRYFYIGLGMLFFGILVNQISSSFIIRYGGNLPVLSDLILDNIPYYNFGYIYDIFNILCLGIFIMYIVFRKQYKNFPYFLALFGILYLIRGICIVLTPFGSPVASYTDLFSKVSEVFNFGMYPSGHTGSSFLAFLLAKGIYKWIIFVCMIGVIITLFLTKGQYSIDILSALIFAYAVYCFGKQYIKMGQDD